VSSPAASSILVSPYLRILQSVRHLSTLAPLRSRITILGVAGGRGWALVRLRRRSRRRARQPGIACVRLELFTFLSVRLICLGTAYNFLMRISNQDATGAWGFALLVGRKTNCSKTTRRKATLPRIPTRKSFPQAAVSGNSLFHMRALDRMKIVHEMQDSTTHSHWFS
jgi:hypothetical protein